MLTVLLPSAPIAVAIRQIGCDQPARWECEVPLSPAILSIVVVMINQGSVVNHLYASSAGVASRR